MIEPCPGTTNPSKSTQAGRRTPPWSLSVRCLHILSPADGYPRWNNAIEKHRNNLAEWRVQRRIWEELVFTAAEDHVRMPVTTEPYSYDDEVTETASDSWSNDLIDATFKPDPVNALILHPTATAAAPPQATSERTPPGRGYVHKDAASFTAAIIVLSQLWIFSLYQPPRWLRHRRVGLRSFHPRPMRLLDIKEAIH